MGERVGTLTTRSGMPTTAAVLARIDQAWTELERSVHALDSRQLAEIRDPAGWAAKAHLIHLVAWEQALVARLDGRAEHEALGIDETLAREGDEDAVDAAIFARRGPPPRRPPPRPRRSGPVPGKIGP